MCWVHIVLLALRRFERTLFVLGVKQTWEDGVCRWSGHGSDICDISLFYMCTFVDALPRWAFTRTQHLLLSCYVNSTGVSYE